MKFVQKLKFNYSTLSKKRFSDKSLPLDPLKFETVTFCFRLETQ